MFVLKLCQPKFEHNGQRSTLSPVKGAYDSYASSFDWLRMTFVFGIHRFVRDIAEIFNHQSEVVFSSYTWCSVAKLSSHLRGERCVVSRKETSHNLELYLQLYPNRV